MSLTADLDAVSYFGGPGGWCVAARELGLKRVVGIELDAAACQTRAAAGHYTVRADVSQLPAGFAPNARGVIASPPCTVWSAAGKRAGVAVTDELAALVRDAFAGLKTRAAHRRVMVRALRRSPWLTDTPSRLDLLPASDWLWDRDEQDEWKRKLLARKDSRAARRRQMAAEPPNRNHLRRAERSARIWAAVRSATLVAEPARFITAGRPEWVALEQVPAVLPLWRVYAAELQALGYSVWTGKLNAALYGVPQTRERAILIASRVRRVTCPEPTHYDPRKGDQLWGEPWVSMAAALGWGMDARPGPAVTAGGTSTGGAEPFPTRARELLAAEQDAGRWVLGGPYRTSPGDRTRPRGLDEPATTVAFGHSSMIFRKDHAGVPEGPVLHTNRDQRPDGTRQTSDPLTAPAPAPALTAKSGGQWIVKGLRNNNNNNNACERSPDEPAGTLFFGHRSNWAAWVTERPATCVQGDPRLGRPGHKSREPGGESQFAVELGADHRRGGRGAPVVPARISLAGNQECPFPAGGRRNAAAAGHARAGDGDRDQASGGSSVTDDEWADELAGYIALHSMPSVLVTDSEEQTAELLIEVGGGEPDVALP